MTSLETAKRIASILDSKKGEEIIVCNVGTLSTLADYFVIASGGSLPHVRAMCDEVEEKLSKEDGIEPQRIEGYQTRRLDPHGLWGCAGPSVPGGQPEILQPGAAVGRCPPSGAAGRETGA